MLCLMPAVRVDPRKVHEFEDERAFDTWLRKNWNKEDEVWIKIHKVRSGLRSITPKQAIDVCLCWGWIDGIRKGHDEASFLQRYTPRTKKSVWSQINIANVERLTQQGRMRPSGLAQVDAAKADGRWAAAYRMSKSEPPADLLAAIRADRQAWATYEDAVGSKPLFADVPDARRQISRSTPAAYCGIRGDAEKRQDDPPERQDGDEEAAPPRRYELLTPAVPPASSRTGPQHLL